MPPRYRGRRPGSPRRRLVLGDALASLGRDFALTDEDAAAIDTVRDRTPGGAAGAVVIVLVTTVAPEASS